MDVNGKVALVTGASKGIGKATALALARKGAHLILVGRDEEGLAAVAGMCDEAGAISTNFIIADLSNYAGLDTVVMGAVRLHDGFDILINNAGFGVVAPIEEVTDEDYDAMMAVNLRAPFMLSQAAVKIMRRRGRGQIVQVTSGLAYRGIANWTVYCATKYGLRGMTEALRQEVAMHGIKVGMVAPGLTATQFFDEFSFPVNLDQAATPEDVAHAVIAMVEQSPSSDIKEITVRNPGAP